MQIALGLVLVVGAGLVVQSFRALAAADPGFNPRGVLTMRVVVPLNSADTAAVHAYNLDVNARLQQLPGVTGVGIVSQLPLTGQGPLLAGRDFTSDDIQNRRRLIVVDDSLAKQAFGSAEKAIGARLRFGPDGAPTYSEIIGVVGHVKHHDLRQVRLPQIYRAIVRGTYCLVIRTDADPALLTGPVRRLLAEAMPGTAIQNVRLLETIVDDALAPHRLAVWLMTGFGVLGFAMRKMGISMIPLVLGMLLGGPMEQNLRRSMEASGGDWSILIASPLSIAIHAITIGLVTTAIVLELRRRRRRVTDPDMP